MRASEREGRSDDTGRETWPLWDSPKDSYWTSISMSYRSFGTRSASCKVSHSLSSTSLYKLLRPQRTSNIPAPTLSAPGTDYRTRHTRPPSLHGDPEFEGSPRRLLAAGTGSRVVRAGLETYAARCPSRSDR